MLDDEDGVDLIREIVDRDVRITKLELKVGYLERQVEGLESEVDATNLRGKDREIQNLKADLDGKDKEILHWQNKFNGADSDRRRLSLDRKTQVSDIVKIAGELERSKQPQMKKNKF
jgi:hypothetical protein